MARANAVRYPRVFQRFALTEIAWLALTDAPRTNGLHRRKDRCCHWRAIWRPGTKIVAMSFAFMPILGAARATCCGSAAGVGHLGAPRRPRRPPASARRHLGAFPVGRDDASHSLAMAWPPRIESGRDKLYSVNSYN